MPNFGDPIKLSTSTRIQVGDYFNRVQKGNWYWGGTSGGSANAHTVTVEGGATSFEDGQIVAFKPGFTNTGSTTLSVNGTTARTVRRPNFSSLIAGDIFLTNSICFVQWHADTSQWILLADPGKRSQIWSPTINGSGAMGVSGGTFQNSNYMLIGDRCIGTVVYTGGSTTGTGTDRVRITFPVAPVEPLSREGVSTCNLRHASGYEIGRVYNNTGGDWGISRGAFGNFPIGADLEIAFNFNYRVNIV